MDPNRKQTPDGKVTMIAGIMVFCFEALNILIMVIRRNVMFGQVLASCLIMALAAYFAVTGKKTMDEWNEKHKDD